jgi:transcriptional regulator with XRE-family HTH domain
MAYMANRPRSVLQVDGDKIRELRDRAGLTLTAFARDVGTDVSHLSRIERGAGGPSNALRNRIAARLGVSIDDIAKPRAKAA